MSEQEQEEKALLPKSSKIRLGNGEILEFDYDVEIKNGSEYPSLDYHAPWKRLSLKQKINTSDNWILNGEHHSDMDDYLWKEGILNEENEIGSYYYNSCLEKEYKLWEFSFFDYGMEISLSIYLRRDAQKNIKEVAIPFFDHKTDQITLTNIAHDDLKIIKKLISIRPNDDDPMEHFWRKEIDFFYHRSKRHLSTKHRQETELYKRVVIGGFFCIPENLREIADKYLELSLLSHA